jgi:hypothetical protein
MSTKALAASIIADLQARLPDQRKTQREALGTLVATMLDVRSPNTVDLASGPPRAAERLDMRLQWVSRVLSNHRIIPDEIMVPFAREAMEKVSKRAVVLVLSMNQSHISAGFEMLMLSLRHQQRAIPLLWCVKTVKAALVLPPKKRCWTSWRPLFRMGPKWC